MIRTLKWFESALAVIAGLAIFVGWAGASWGAYANNGDGTVTDSSTGLMWQQADDRVRRSWENAISYCEALNLAGKTDWRLPNIRELQSIVDFGRYNPAINLAFSCQPDWYWSGSSNENCPVNAWSVDFKYGVANQYVKYQGGWRYARCVRGGPAGSLGHLDITHPDGGEVFVKGQNYSITWNSQNVTGTIQIDLYKGGRTSQQFLRQIAVAAPNTGSYPFTPPDDIPEGSDYLIRISAQGGSLWDFSNSFFSTSGKNISKSMPWLHLLLE